jgi:hypothetical protein
MSDRDDDLPTEAVPAVPRPTPHEPMGDDVWAMTAPDAGSVFPEPQPRPEPTAVMPSVPPPPAPPAPPSTPPIPLAPAGGEPPRRGRGWMIAGIAVAVALVAGLLTWLLVRDDGGEVTGDTTTTAPASTEVPTSPPDTAPITVPPTAPPTEAPTTTEETTTTTEATTTTTEPAPTWPDGLRVVVAAPDGIHVLQDQADDLVAAEQVAIALANPGGGFLVQDRSGRWSPDGGEVLPGATTIRRTGGASGVLLAPVGEQWLRLHDVGVVDGQPVALVSIRSGTTPDDDEEELLLVPLGGGEPRVVGVIGGWESGTGRLHLGGRGIVGESFVEAVSGPLLLTVDGNQLIDPARLGLRSTYVDCGRECPHHFATDPSGATIGWLEDGTLVVVGATDGRRIADVQLPGDVADQAVELELLEGVAVISRRTEPGGGSPLPPVVVDLATGQRFDLTTPGLATAVR